jgi:hypothetical protein
MNESIVQQDPHAEAKEALERANPQSWIWDEDGDELAGHFVDYDEATTREGETVRVALFRAPDEAYRSLWLFEHPKMLVELFEEHQPKPGDYVIIRRYAKKKTADGERSYWPFAMAVVLATSETDESQGVTQAALEKEREARDADLSEAELEDRRVEEQDFADRLRAERLSDAARNAKAVGAPLGQRDGDN